MKMKFALVCLLLNLSPALLAEGPAIETIVCVRHGEKPKEGLGQLTCRGLNRALALPDVLLQKYGMPQFVFAPNPSPKADHGKKYFYVRPLVTIEPTAIRCGLPVNTEFDFTNIAGLQKELDKPRYSSATIFLAWEHGWLDSFAREMVKAHGGDSNQVPAWPYNDFDTIFVLKVTRVDQSQSIAFKMDQENLTNLSDLCPGQSAR
jgi:hypothetical protein